MNDVTCHSTQYKRRPYVGGGTQTSNSKALLTEPLRPLFMDKKNRTRGTIDYCSKRLALIVMRKSILETYSRGEAGPGGGEITKKSCKY